MKRSIKINQSSMVWLHLCLLFHFPSFSSSSFNFLCHPKESSALLQFKFSFKTITYTDDDYGCDEPLKTATWKNGTDCCSSWSGVTCDAISGRVIGLNLGCDGLQGTIHPNSTLFYLAHLQSLNLSYNHFSQSQLHSHFGGFLSLTHLDLSDSKFEGEIPPQISHLSKLASLHLSGNSELVWKETTFKRLVQNATNLRELFLDYTNMSSIRPNSMFSLLNHSSSLVTLSLESTGLRGNLKNGILCLPGLQELHMSGNDDLQGQLPELSCSTSLTILDLSGCQFEGPIPPSFSNLTHLTSLDLSQNQLINASIPSWCLSLPSLVELDLSNNQFTGHISAISSYSLKYLSLSSNKLQGNIPESIFNLTNLAVLCLSSNNLSGLVNFQLFSKLQNLGRLSLSQNSQLSLKFESNEGNYSFYLLELSSVSLTEFPRLSRKLPSLLYLDLSNNKLNGKVPSWLFEMDSLQVLNLSRNLFTTVDQFSRNLAVLDLSFNSLAGDISLSICNPSSLKILNLAHNELTGTIPQCLANLSSLVVLDLQMNKLNGTLPNIFSKDSELGTLNLYGNQLEGLLPKSLSNCIYLRVLSLGNNHIEDTFPRWLQTLQSLEVLILRGNKLHGHIAPGKIKHPFPSLIIFDISCNNFSGPLPKSYIKKFEAMKNVTQVERDSSSEYMETEFIIAISDEFYYDSVTVAMKGINIPMVKIPTIFVSIDLSQNKFEGEIPDVTGEFLALIGLNLSHNRLNGPIPQSLGNLTNLESLDLSSNMLTGGIPSELTNLNFLEVLNLSYNHLVGEIPQGKQFNTFLNDSYEGNLGLCGLPLPRKCRPEQHSPPSPSPIFWSEEKFGFGWKPVAIGYGCGMVFGVGLGYCVLKMGKPRWLVIIFGGQPNRRRVKRRTRMRRTRTVSQLVQMS